MCVKSATIGTDVKKQKKNDFLGRAQAAPGRAHNG